MARNVSDKSLPQFTSTPHLRSAWREVRIATHLGCLHKADDCVCRDPRAEPKSGTYKLPHNAPCQYVLIAAQAKSSQWATCKP